MVRALLAFKRGEPRVCAMVKAPSPEEEDRRRVCREGEILIAERVKHVNRIKGLLFSQGISGYVPLRKNRRIRLTELQTVMAALSQPIVSPGTSCTWLFSEIESDGDTLFGLCDLGMGEPELGYASFSEMTSIRIRLGTVIERDLHFKASRPMSEYVIAARVARRIVDV